MKCERCQFVNTPSAPRCTRCNAPLRSNPPPEQKAGGEAPKAAVAPAPMPPASPAPSAGPAPTVAACAYCQGVFGPGDLYQVDGKPVCEQCLSKAEGAPGLGSGGRGPGGHGGMDKKYLKERLVADKLRGEGKTPSATSMLWPPCHRHPNRRTKDKCRVCGKSVCAMCARRRVDDVFCLECFERASSSASGQRSGKFTGFSASYFETIKDVLFSPSNFFGNLPSKGGSTRPLLFAFLNFLPGCLMALAALRLLVLSGPGVSFEALDLEIVLPVLYGALVFSGGLTLLGWLPFHALARLLGGKAEASRTFRMFALASPFSLVTCIPPFAGIPLAAVFSATTLIRAIAEVHEVDVFRSFLVYMGSVVVLGAALGAAALFLVFPGTVV